MSTCGQELVAGS